MFFPKRAVFQWYEGPAKYSTVGENTRDAVVKPKEKPPQRQYFALGEHQVLDRDKLPKDYVSQISGSVDINGFDHSKSPDRFFRDEVSKPSKLLIDLYTKNRRIFTPSALMFIEENIGALRELAMFQPQNKAQFDLCLGGYVGNQIDGPDGVLNLLLAFNRVVSKLKPNELVGMANPEAQQMLKIDLQKRATRSVEVSIFTPEITKPDISKFRPDLLLETPPQKRLKPDGTLEVQYWVVGSKEYQYTNIRTGMLVKVPATPRRLVISFTINPKTQMVTITQYLKQQPSPPIVTVLSITELDRQLSLRGVPDSFRYP